MGVADHVQRLRPARTRESDAVLEERPRDPLPPERGLDEERIEFGIAILSRHDGRKADDGGVAFRNEHVPLEYPCGRNVDRIGVLKECGAIARVPERCPRLQRLERRTLIRHRRADRERAAHRSARSACGNPTTGQTATIR